MTAAKTEPPTVHQALTAVAFLDAQRFPNAQILLAGIED